LAYKTLSLQKNEILYGSGFKIHNE
jgi:hypothetical protein